MTNLLASFPGYDVAAPSGDFVLTDGTNLRVLTLRRTGQSFWDHHAVCIDPALDLPQAYACGASITDRPGKTKCYVGFCMGDTVPVQCRDGVVRRFAIMPDHNNNIRFEPV